MSAVLLTEQKLLGLFELDDTGRVLYSRVEPDGEQPDGAEPDISGLNFYEHVASFENVEEFRQRVTQFARSSSPVDNFTFDCLYKGSQQTVKVLLARIRERVDNNRTKSVLVHIRKLA